MSVCVQRASLDAAPSAWTRRKSAACARFAIRARATLPMLSPAVRARVITTRTPARRRSVRNLSDTASVRSGSRIPVTTPCVPPPSKIFRVDDPGPFGSVRRFASRSCPGSTTTTGAAASAVPAKAVAPAKATSVTRVASRKAQRALRARRLTAAGPVRASRRR